MQSNQQLCKLLSKLLPVLEKSTSNPKDNGGGRGGRKNLNAGKGEISWRTVASKEGEATTKLFVGVTYKWCENCYCGGELWTKGEEMHDTADHDPTKRKK